MFERYTEKARRVIFFARYEASAFGSPEINTEHLLLGLLREARGSVDGFLRTPLDAEALRALVQQACGERQPVSASVDLPLNNAAKRVLSYAAEEADRAGHKHVGSEHLFLGLLRERESLAAEVLQKHGASVDEVRRKMRESGPWELREMKGAGQGGGGGVGMGSGSAAAMRNVELVGEDGKRLETLFWNARIGRMPQIGESVEIEQDGRRTHYRVLDVLWQVGKGGDWAGNTGQVVLRVRAEDSGGGAEDSSAPAPEI